MSGVTPEPNALDKFTSNNAEGTPATETFDERDWDAQSVVSDAISELPEWHDGSNERCDNPDCNGYHDDYCECECEICIFRHLRDGHPRKFKQALRTAFQNTKTWSDSLIENPHLKGPDRRYFCERKDYALLPPQLSLKITVPRLGDLGNLPNEVLDQIVELVGGFDIGSHSKSPSLPPNPRDHHSFTFAIGQMPCTEMTPWKTATGQWTDRCPNDRRGLTALTIDNQPYTYVGKILPCLENWCLFDSVSVNPVQLWKDPYRKYTPTTRSPNTPEAAPYLGRRFVCEDHFEDTKRFFDLDTKEKVENLYKSHLIRFCKVHEMKLLAKHPYGKNTCTCRNVNLTRFQCRNCFQEKVEKLQRNFRARVDPKWRGCADKSITEDGRYYQDPEKVRAMLQEVHPCSQKCGGKRQCGRSQDKALDCRCCGGIIITRTAPPRGLHKKKVKMPVRKTQK